MSSRLNIDETALSNGELYTIITNKEAKGRKGAIVAMIKWTCVGGDKEVAPLEMHKLQEIVSRKLTIKRIIEVRKSFVFQIFAGFAFQDIWLSERIRE